VMTTIVKCYPWVPTTETPDGKMISVCPICSTTMIVGTWSGSKCRVDDSVFMRHFDGEHRGEVK
jgi:hypothetical protein